VFGISKNSFEFFPARFLSFFHPYKNPFPSLFKRMASTTKESGEADLYPIAVLIDELKHEEKNIRLNAMKSIQTIGKIPRLCKNFIQTTIL
jgi:hypothetical protein